MIPIGIEGLQRAVAVGEVLRRVHDRGLSRLPLLGCHRFAVHDPLQGGRWCGRQCRYGRIMRQPTGSHDEDPLVQRRQVVADRGAERPHTPQRSQRGGDRVDEDRDHRPRRGVAEKLLQRLDRAVVDVHARRDRDVHAGFENRAGAVCGDVRWHVRAVRRGCRSRRRPAPRCRCRTAASSGRRTRCSGRARR